MSKIVQNSLSVNPETHAIKKVKADLNRLTLKLSRTTGEHKRKLLKYQIEELTRLYNSLLNDNN